MNPGLIGGIVGSIIGVAGGLLGTYLGVKNTKGPRERAFAIKVSIACWIFALAFVFGMCLIPGLYKLFLIPIYGVGLVAGILWCIWWNMKQERIRLEESKENPVAPATQIIPRRCPQCGAELKPDVSEGLCPACLLQRGIATEGGAPPGTPPFVPPTIPDLAKLFPQLEILELIGQGGMGAVYKARQPALDRFVALKILSPRSGGDLDFASRFTREARALAKLSHPNIVGVYDFGIVGQASSLSPSEKTNLQSETGWKPVPLHYFIMEYVDGPNLRQVEQAGKLSPRDALEIIPQICAALQFAHDEGIVHRDIKPENVLLDKKGHVKIADFGLAKILGQEPKDFRLTGVRDVMGTPHYMAPEQIEKPQTVDHRADIYSLGVVFYEMLTGELPLGKFQPPSSCTRGMQIDVRLDEVVLRALAKEPELRYQQASQVKTAVETIATTTAPGGSGHESAPSPAQEGQSQLTSAATTSPFRRGAQIGFSVFLLIVMAVSIITFLMPKDYTGIALVRMTGPPAAQDPYHFQTELEVIQSQAVLAPVAASLNLGQRWGKKFSGGKALSDDETVVLMKRMLDLQPVRNTALIEIRFHSDSPKEAAEIANKIAEIYCARPPEHTGEIIDRAVPPFHPVRPNVPLNIFIGVVAGIGLGISAGVVVGLFTFWRGRAARRAMSPPSVQKPDRFWRWFAVTVLALISIPIAIAILGLLAAIAIPNFVRARQHSQTVHGQQLAQEGWKLWQAHKLDQATAKFNEAVQFAPDDANAWNGLGWSEFNSGKTGEAEKAFQKAVSLEPNHPAALNGLGQIYLSLGNYDEAEKFLLKAASQAPAAWFGLARLYLLEGRFEPAEKWAQKIVDSGQADDIARQMLNAAKEKHLDDKLRLMIVPLTTNAPPASAEIWSPTLAPGEKPDLEKILNETKDLMNQGRYEEALQRHIWYFNHALEFNPGLTGVRLSFALSNWVELARRYPKAMQALTEIRDRNTQKLIEGKGYSDLFSEVNSINGYLNQDEATYALFKTLDAKDPKLAQRCYFYAESLLAQKGEYPLCRKYMGDPQFRFNLIQNARETELDVQKRMARTRELLAPQPQVINPQRVWTNTMSPPDTSETMKKSANDRFVGQTRQLIEILVATGSQEDAEKIQTEAMAVLADPRLKSAVTDAEQKTGR